MEDFMRDMVRFEKGEEGEAPGLPDKFFHEVDYVIRTWLQYKLHHILPEDGSYNSQDEHLMKDFHTMNVYYARISAGVSAVEQIPDDVGDWTDLLGD